MDRVIQDSDEEEDDALSDDVPTSVDAGQQQCPSEQRTLSSISARGDHDEVHEVLIPGKVGSQAEETPGAPVEVPLGVNFDDFLQSQDTAGGRLSSSQQRREDRWIPAEVGHGSIGSVMTEIGLAQRRLFDDDDAAFSVQNLIAAPTTMDIVRTSYSMNTGHGVYGNMARLGDELGNEENWHNHSERQTMPLEVREEGNLALQTDQEDINVQTSMDSGCQVMQPHTDTNRALNCGIMSSHENTSYNFFDSVMSHPADSAPGEFLVSTRFHNDDQLPELHRTPLRSKSLQGTLYSPHDTEPISSVLSPRSSRVKSDNLALSMQQASQQSTGDELAGSVTVELPPMKKKRGRPKKQVVMQDEDDELANSPVGQDLAKPEKSTPGGPSETFQEQTDHSDDIVMVPIDKNTVSHGGDHETPPSAAKDSKLGVVIQAQDPYLAEADRKESKNLKAKEPKKKKLKRGKTTSAIQTKSHESDVEGDVIWVNEKSGSGKLDSQEGVSPFDKSTITNMNETLLSIPKAESNAEEAAQKPSKLVQAAPKKRGRKRKKTDEQLDEEQQQPTTSPNELLDKAQTDPSFPDLLKDDSKNTINNQMISEEDHPDTHTIAVPPEEQEQEQPAEMNALKTPQKQTPNPPGSGRDPRKGPDKHSPISGTSKVPFRVGLSRRARIAPLLRVVRK
ncbi:hypothetical protein ASPZODRAFT_134353 [Penicilliopsis zonata CBS 506.65]|uniref:Uncharacterized protein n=1 Tax=Penicilliopsis zonata CBS 506.65 TaxID=1073090 RepID=A0A1L9SCT1_9EURO|nr:hypothetical protein ASPZODRAFT_134353 [Penicilliopsis zonata CBS 506.65]OJJ44928.1 hypothetical protein ASPZODRAFT_134353 [Penicilliopsis zonata CBS 506.65]